MALLVKNAPKTQKMSERSSMFGFPRSIGTYWAMSRLLRLRHYVTRSLNRYFWAQKYLKMALLVKNAPKTLKMSESSCMFGFPRSNGTYWTMSRLLRLRHYVTRSLNRYFWAHKYLKMALLVKNAPKTLKMSESSCMFGECTHFG